MFYLFLCISSILVFGETTYTLSKNGNEMSSLGYNRLSIPNSVPNYVMRNHCPGNMRLYPRKGEKISWTCGCMPKYLYLPLTNSCHEAYRQGPCPQGQYVNLVMGEKMPRCTENPCSVDGLVPYNGNCYALNRLGGPCNSYSFLSVNETTYEVHCDSIFDSRIYEMLPKIYDEGTKTYDEDTKTCDEDTKTYDEDSEDYIQFETPYIADAPIIITEKPESTCPPGTKRALNGDCWTVLTDNFEAATFSGSK